MFTINNVLLPRKLFKIVIDAPILAPEEEEDSLVSSKNNGKKAMDEEEMEALVDSPWTPTLTKHKCWEVF